MTFANLKITGWRQFARIEIEFHERMTVITGSNGTGKTTLLKILARHFGWPSMFLAAPKISKDGAWTFLSGIFSLFGEARTANIVGYLTYSNAKVARLEVPSVGSVNYDLTVRDQHSVEGLYIGSHRPTVSYHRVTNIPTSAITAEQAFNNYRSEMLNRYQHSHSQFSPVYRMKEALISMATFGLGNANVQAIPTLEVLFRDFEGALRKILPPSLGFKELSIRIPDVVIVTDTGEFVLDDASGGIMSLFELSWQIFLFSRNKNKISIVIDEPENHLHPGMQRSLLRRLMDAFPNAQFIVVSHSPFIVSSVKNSNVYVLRYENSFDQEQIQIGPRVVSIKLDQENKAGTANEILRDVLGVPVTLPEWAENELEGIIRNYTEKVIDQEMLAGLRSDLREAGLGDFYPDALNKLAAKK